MKEKAFARLLEDLGHFGLEDPVRAAEMVVKAYPYLSSDQMADLNQAVRTLSRQHLELAHQDIQEGAECLGLPYEEVKASINAAAHGPLARIHETLDPLAADLLIQDAGGRPPGEEPRARGLLDRVRWWFWKRRRGSWTD